MFAADTACRSIIFKYFRKTLTSIFYHFWECINFGITNYDLNISNTCINYSILLCNYVFSIYIISLGLQINKC